KKDLKKIFLREGLQKIMQQAIRLRIEADKAALDAGFTTNNFVGELGEKLAHAVYGGDLLPNSSKSADIKTCEGILLQVKTRKPNKGKQFGSIRSWDFDYLIAITLGDKYEVIRALKIPVSTCKELAEHRGHTNSFIIKPTRKLLSHADIEDVTTKFQSVAL
ncbi:hypothetical protein ES936_23525, partial [Salmonella enterica]|nr:hypothetical protein [Salmonella enterica subsp. enterica serovar Braenderup]EAA9783989.1 hypothetical protein [Salmonella enterica subsp. enterica serovar Cerro]EAM6064775.1 hypothetical protein [Salmonella enterica]EBZ3391626.1 hypothetical protein [Salmonella enterica subsp. enterica serovar Thompson]EAN9358482.1 hypothetical protein [Salmonella enterica]